MTTRAYNISELGLMRLEDVLKSIYNDEGNDLEIAIHDLAFGEREHKVEIPIKSYAASVVERNQNDGKNFALVKYNSQFKTLNYYKRRVVDGMQIGWTTIHIMVDCPINPFTGMLNPDGTQRTSATRKEIEQWKKEG